MGQRGRRAEFLAYETAGNVFKANVVCLELFQPCAATAVRFHAAPLEGGNVEGALGCTMKAAEGKK
jgi:hypothetical protein